MAAPISPGSPASGSLAPEASGAAAAPREGVARPAPAFGPALERPSGFRGLWRADLTARELYSQGAGIARVLPAAVAVPADADDVSTLVVAARRDGFSLIPRGSGSGMAAGAVGTGVIVDLSRLQRIEAVDVHAQRVRCGPGALRGAVDTAARAVGLRFPVDPSSGAFCTIGGMVAANAAGARTLRFGDTRAWVHGLECVFANGVRAWVRADAPAPEGIPLVRAMLDAVRTAGRTLDAALLSHRGVRKESSGYAIGAAHAVLQRDAQATGEALLTLLAGSEGTLALFTAVELRLVPVAGATATLLATFDSLDRATLAAMAARDAGATACELLDRTFLDVAAQRNTPGIPRGVDAVLIAEVEGEHAAAARDAAILLGRAFTRAGAREVTTASHAGAEKALWSLRHAASPILAQLAPRLRSMQFIEDGCVPPERLPDYVRGVRGALTRADTLGVIFGHAGDAHVHVNPLLDVTRTDWRDRTRALLDEVCDLTARLGGTLAGEHGDGRLRASLLPRVWSSEAMTAFRVLKQAGDPWSVLNHGVKLAVDGDDPLMTLRHDPAAPPLGAIAHDALAAIERDRAWHRFRLHAIDPTL
ncbi:MAG: FAD-binding oxidoreductase [Gemmatimonadaceae bacterium]|nr:FAD-binding oxidoreductase [Gemmatimonadaceae bacterium]